MDYDHVDEVDYPLEQAPLLTSGVKYVDSDEAFKQWICLYPVYLNAEKSAHDGRRVPKEMAYPDPYPRAIVEAVRQLQLPVFVEPQKRHPKDQDHGGRIRTQLKDDHGRFINRSIQTRRELYRRVAQLLHDIQPGMPKPEPHIPEHVKMMLQQTMPVDEPEPKAEEAPKQKKKKGKK
jgi:signal recognition particle subunit SEC65